MSDKKQIPGLPVATEAKDNDRLIKRDTDSGSDEGLAVSVLLERSGEQVDAHAAETGGIHGIPANERAIHSEELRAAVSTATATAEAVSMTGKGAIVESDTNANGSYTRWENGEQVCFHALADAETHTWTFPAAFNADPFVSGLVNRSSSPGRFITTAALGASSYDLSVWDGSTGEAASGSIRVTAWGFWK